MCQDPTRAANEMAHNFLALQEQVLHTMENLMELTRDGSLCVPIGDELLELQSQLAQVIDKNMFFLSAYAEGHDVVFDQSVADRTSKHNARVTETRKVAAKMDEARFGPDPLSSDNLARMKAEGLSPAEAAREILKAMGFQG